MSEAQHSGATIRCLVIPLADVNVLLPGSVVAEVAAHHDVETLAGGYESTWLPGHALWRGLRIPLVDLEQILGVGSSRAGLRARLIVLKGLSDEPGLPFFGFVSPQTPRLLGLSEGMMEPLDEARFRDAPGQLVLAAGEAAILLDVEEIEQRLREALRTSG